MFEILLSAMLVGLFFLMGWTADAPAESILFAGLALTALGFGYGIPTALVYHYRLYQALVAVDRLPVRWWLQPTALHDQIPSHDRAGVLRWAAIGGSGFVLVVVGIILTSMGVWRTLSG